jgi:hypothetical protein
MNRERLQQMVTMLRGLPSEGEVGFRLTSWHCGTTACAVGHACLNPAFQEQGLSLVKDGTAMVPLYGGHAGWNAVREFFGIDSDEDAYLFLAWEYPDGSETTPDQVADRIELFLQSAEVTA